MSNAGQAILTVVGTAIGFWVGYPGLGFALGSLAGNVFFPTQLPTQRGPKLDDLSVQGSAVGVPIPIVYGAFRVAGNIIWSTDLIPTTTTERVGGKGGGGGQKVESTTYAVNFAVGLCEGPITAVRRIWAGGKLIYDRRAQLPGESATTYNNRLAAATSFDSTSDIYLGTEDQLPDPEIESWLGAGNVPAYRGLAYMLFRDFQLADYGNNLAATALSFEIIVGGGIDFQDITECAPPYIAPFEFDVFNPYNLDNDHLLTAMIHRLDADGSPSVFFSTTAADVTMAEALSDLIGQAGVSSPNGNPLAPDWPNYVAISAYPDKNNISSTTNNTTMFDGSLVTEGAYRCSVYVFPFVSSSITSFHKIEDIAGATIQAKLATLAGGGVDPGEYVYIEYDGAGVAGHGPPPCALFYNNGQFNEGGVSGVNPIWNWDGGSYPTQPEIYQDTSLNIWFTCTPITISGIRIPRQPSQKCDPRTPPNPDPPDAPFPGYCDIGGVYYEQGVDWTPQFDPGNVALLQNYNTRVDYREQVGPMLLDEDPNYASQSYWEARYAEAVADGTMPAALTYDGSFTGDYPVNLNDSFTTPQAYYCLFASQSFISTELIRLRDIVADLCRRSELEVDQYDSTDLIQLVHGYAVGQVMDAASAIQPLRLYGFFDMVESDGVLLFWNRGRDVVATLDELDLAAHQTNNERPSSVQVQRAQDIELPRVVRIKYAMADKDYEPGEQVASRLNTTANQIADLQVPVAMTDAYAAAIADVTLYEAWQGRNTYTFHLSQKWLALEPTDPILLPVDGALQRVRLVREEFMMPGVKNITAVRDGGAIAYTSYLVGDQPLVPEQEIVLKDTTVAIYLDLPMLRDEDSDGGYYAALRQASDEGAWPGASVLRSPDGGLTYLLVATATVQSVTGTIDDITGIDGDPAYNFFPPGAVEVPNYYVELIVDLDLASMSLSSITEDSMLAGFNAAAVGAHGRWEIIQILNAENVSTSAANEWKLTGLVRGRKGTDSVMDRILGVPGDQFVMLQNVVRVPGEIANLGASRLHKAVTSGLDPAAVTGVAFTNDGAALKPYSPVHIDGTRDGSDNLTITWVRRSRFGQELPSGSDIILGEANEEYEVDIIDVDEVTVLRTFTGITSPTQAYTAAQQTTDFGSPQDPVLVDVYQISTVVGRGFRGRRNI